MWFFLVLLFGLRFVRTAMADVSLVCRYCGERAQQRIVKRSMRLTVFFIPLLSLKTTYLMECSNCGAESRISADQAQRSVEWVRTREGKP